MAKPMPSDSQAQQQRQPSPLAHSSWQSPGRIHVSSKSSSVGSHAFDSLLSPPWGSVGRPPPGLAVSQRGQASRTLGLRRELASVCKGSQTVVRTPKSQSKSYRVRTQNGSLHGRHLPGKSP
eukprot:8082179-Karenia_brevis.AAC.1